MFVCIYWLLSLASCFAFLDEIDKTRINASETVCQGKKRSFCFCFSDKEILLTICDHFLQSNLCKSVGAISSVVSITWLIVKYMFEVRFN